MKSPGIVGTALMALHCASCLGRVDVGRVAGGDDGGPSATSQACISGVCGPSGGLPDAASAGADAEPGSGSSGGASSSGGSEVDAVAFDDGAVAFDDGATSSGSAEAGVAAYDGSTSFAWTPAPAGLAGFAFVVNGVVQTPMDCLTDNWEFPKPAAQQDVDGVWTPESGSMTAAVCSARMTTIAPPCPGLSVFIVNTGQLPMAYTAEPLWSAGAQPPGVPFGLQSELSGVLDPGAQVDITSAYVGGWTAVLGSADPFSDGSKYAGDESMIPWPAGVAGSGGATEMNVAEIQVNQTCVTTTGTW